MANRTMPVASPGSAGGQKLTHYMLRTLRDLGIVKKNSLELTAKGMNHIVHI